MLAAAQLTATQFFISIILGTNSLNSADAPLSNKQTQKVSATQFVCFCSDKEQKKFVALF